MVCYGVRFRAVETVRRPIGPQSNAGFGGRPVPQHWREPVPSPRVRLIIVCASFVALFAFLVPQSAPGASGQPETVEAATAPPRRLIADATTTTTAPPPTTTLPSPPTTVAPPPTTTQPPPPPPDPEPAAATYSRGGSGDPGDIASWERLAQCESGGDWSIDTGNGYYGGIQFSLSSWQAVGGTGYPHQSSKATQIEMGQRLHAQGGWSHWPGCSRSFGWL